MHSMHFKHETASDTQISTNPQKPNNRFCWLTDESSPLTTLNSCRLMLTNVH